MSTQHAASLLRCSECIRISSHDHASIDTCISAPIRDAAGGTFSCKALGLSLYTSALLREHCKKQAGDVRSRDLGRQNAYKWPHPRKNQNPPVWPLLQSRMTSRAILQNPTLFFVQVPIRSRRAGMRNYELKCFRDGTYKIRSLYEATVQKRFFFFS